MSAADSYRAFLEAKVATAKIGGSEIADEEIHHKLLPHQRACVRWAVRGGRRGLFEAFGLGKTVQQIEILRLIRERAGGRALIVAPLGVRQEFFRDAEMLGTSLTFVRWSEEVHQAELPGLPPNSGLYLTNYESLRDGRLDPNLFAAVSLDEASCLRGFGGTKTFREFMRMFEFNPEIRYRFVATATPAPNEYLELLAYAAFLEIMDVGEAKTRFFRRNSEKADKLTLHPHKEEEFWLWVNSWAVFLQRPSDLGFSDEGYALPPLDIRWHEIPTDHANAGQERDGQQRLIKNAALGVVDAAREKRDSLELRIEKLKALRAEDPNAHRIIWHDLEAERKAIEAAIPSVTSVYGNQKLDDRERAIIAFSDGKVPELAAKPVLAGSGCNFQRHCAWAIFLGIGFKFNDFVQAIHRLHRYLQANTVRLDLIYTEAEREVRKTLLDKWRQHERMVERMSEIIRRYRLNQAVDVRALERAMSVDRQEVRGENYHLICGDACEELPGLPDASAGLIVTSIPFSTQYEYTPSYRDLGHTDNDRHFWEHMDFVTPHLLRILEPGRVAAIHVKDRIVPGGITGLGFQTLSRFSDHCADHFEAHGFAFLGRKTIVTDVVRENNQTYRLGWTEQCKDGSRMGVGVPEYLLLFRKPPTDKSNGYADRPVVKDKKLWIAPGTPGFEEWIAGGWQNQDGYSRARWQLDAHGFARSSGDRPLLPSDLDGLAPDQIYKLFKRFSLTEVYGFEKHVELAEYLESKGSLPPTFMLLPPASWHPDVWADVARMRTLNASQAMKGREMHLCPLQLDIADRAILQFSMPGDAVLDPFAGIGTVPARAVRLKRRAVGVELNPGYFADQVGYVEAEAQRRAVPSLFDLLADEEEPAA